MALTTIDDRGLKTPIDLLDSEKIRFGTGNDLEIYHSGSHAYITNTTNSLLIESGNTVLRSASQENYIVATLNSDVELYYDNVKKLATTSTGVDVTGRVLADTISVGQSGDGRAFIFEKSDATAYSDSGTNAQFSIGNNNASAATNSVGIYLYTDGNGRGIVNLNACNNGTNSSADFKIQTRHNSTLATRVIVTSNGNLQIPNDTGKLELGTSQDLKIYHDGTNTHLENNTGILNLRSTGNIVLSKAYSETLAKFEPDGAVELYYDNDKKVETTANGIKLLGTSTSNEITPNQIKFNRDSGSSYIDQFGTGDISLRTTPSGSQVERLKITSAGNVQIPNDTGKLELGTSQDLQIYHDGSHSYITDAGTGNLYISGHSSISIDKYTGEEMANFNADADVELFFDNVKKFETEANGVQIFDHLGVGAASNTGSCVYIKTPEGSYGSNTTRRGLLVQESAWSDGNLIEAQGSLGATIFKVGGHPNDIEIPNDTSKLKLGESGDIEIYHDGTNNYLDAHNGTLYIRGSSNVIAIQAVDGENAVRSAPNAEVKLYFDGNEKVRTEDWGATIHDKLRVVATEGADAKIEVFADQGDDNNDKWQLDATTGGEFFLRSWGAGGLNTAWYASYNSTFGNPIFHGPIGGIDFSANRQDTSTDTWNEYVYDGHLHRTAGQAYMTIDDWLYLRDMSNAENKRFQFNVNSGNAGATNDWEDDQFDFAEMFEWSDGNPSGEDRIGNTVAVDGLTGKIKIAEDGDTVIGVVSGTAAFTANAGVMGWQGQYLRDEWGRYIYEDNTNADGTPGKILKVNPDFDPTKEYQTREERKEWDKIGIIGQCYVRKTAVKPSSWIKLKEVDSTKDFYLIK